MPHEHPIRGSGTETEMQQNSHLETISAIRFGFYGARKAAAMGYADIARNFRATARKHVAALRVLRKEAA